MAKLTKINNSAKSEIKVQKSLYPLDYNRDNPMTGFNEWAKYIRSESIKASYNSSIVLLMSFDINHAIKVLEAKAVVLEGKIMSRLLGDAIEIINK